MRKGMVSIVIPNYNYAHFLPECIESVLAQTYENWELIVVDDNSNDNSREIVSKYIKKYPDLKIQLFHNKKGPGGTPGVVNIGINNMRGEYFAWLSSDDVFHQKKLEKQVALLEQNSSVGMIYTRVEQINEKGKKIREGTFIKPDSRKQFFLEIIKHNFINGNTVLIRKNVLDKIGPLLEKDSLYPEIWRASEYEMWLKIGLFFEVVGMNECLHLSRLHKDNSPYNLSGLGNKLKGLFLSRFFKRYNILDIAEVLNLKEDEIARVEAIIRKELEKSFYSEVSVYRHDKLIKRNPSLEKKIMKKLENITRSAYLTEAAEFYLQVNKRDTAVKIIKQAVKLNEEDLGAQAWYTWASYEKTKGNFKKAKKLFKTVIMHEPAVNSALKTGAYFHLGEIYFKEGDKMKARSYFGLCLEENKYHKKAAEYLCEFEEIPSSKSY